MVTATAVEISRESIESGLGLYLRKEVLGSGKAEIRGDETIDAIFERSPDLVVGKNLLGLEFAGFIERTYGVPSGDVSTYDPKKVTFNQAVDLIYQRVSGGRQ